MAPEELPQRELRNDAGGVLRRVEAGETFRITVRGRAVAELRPLGARPQFASGARLRTALAGSLTREQATAMQRDLDDAAGDRIDEL